MSRDLHADARRLRKAILIGGVLVLAAFAFAAVRALRPEWKAYPRAFGSQPAIVQATTCTGAVDRCETCHLGAQRADRASETVALPLRACSGPLRAHTARGVGCGDCHGGNGRALEAAVAHAFPGTASRDAMLREPHIEASCARCHVPGDQIGMEHLVRGEKLFAELGCAMCHPLSGDGRGGWDFGPDLRSTGRKSGTYLETSLKDPAADFPGSTMPSFAMLASSDKAAFTDLLVFLESLELSRAAACSVRERSAQLSQMPCTACHSGAGGKASGRLSHRCLYIRGHTRQLACSACHPEAIPEAGAGHGACPVEREHRAACAACHDGQ